MLRVHFTDADLARVEVATAPDPLWETVLASQQLTAAGRVPPVFRAWRRRTGAVLADRQLSGTLGLLRALAPAASYFPDFLTPAAGAEGLRSALEAVRATPPGRLGQELRLLARLRYPHGAPSWLRDLASGDRDRLAEVVEALRTLHHAVIAPEWTDVAATVAADRAVRVRAVRDGGGHRLLSTLGPRMRWRPPVLYTDYPVDRDLHLDGRGLRLIPSYFCRRTPVTLADASLRPVLVCPAEQEAAWAAALRHERRPDALAAVLGRTRARILEALDEAATTGELARRLGVSAAGASQHAHALAGAGLVRSRRTGSHVLHTLTPLGRALLHGELPVD
ncbi:winged helix-turn-helix domain-containing protein [Streptomyces fuscichromogenes]|uniref:Transcriptional regulator n=1 Tax=Streptomyces fuscichromogenes TaxID=1324013 RepID=A0A918CXH0_9ACTN|nr:winged helix-turn-helix domain-containing protein [Streptomyces fuscichromogenes]GGN45101.1 transcriptional regulator [Streptomyces fuscichromogenes]